MDRPVRYTRSESTWNSRLTCSSAAMATCAGVVQEEDDGPALRWRVGEGDEDLVMMRLACHGHTAVQESGLGSLACQRPRHDRQQGRRPDHSQIHRSTSRWIIELGAGMGIGPGGFEPPYPDPKSGVLPLDEGPATMKRLNLAKPKASSITLWPDCAGRPFLRHRGVRFSAQRET